MIFHDNLHSNCPPFHILINYQRKGLKPTSTTTFHKPLPSNVEVNNVSNFIAYFVGRHRVLLASEEFLTLIELFT